MKKNFIIFGIAFLFAVSLVFAGITSYVLKEGESLGKAKIDAVLKDKVVIGEKVYSKGEIFYEDGKAYRVKEIKPKSWFFGSDEVEIEEVEEGRPEANSKQKLYLLLKILIIVGLKAMIVFRVILLREFLMFLFCLQGDLQVLKLMLKEN
jgi:hypothetical protein